MIIEPESTEVISNISTSRQRNMGISEDGLAHIMSTLTHLYGDQQTAVIREIVTNAVDSHVLSGQTKHIEVTLPDRFTNMFVVEDFGVGMSASELDEYYGDYGASSKRRTNTLIGAFGLGAKSPLAIANQFTVRAVKDGRLSSALIQKAPNGLNTIDIITETDTTLPNGVKVSVPIDSDSISAFRDKADRFFLFSEPSMVLVDGEEPESIYTASSKVSDPDNPDFVAYIRNSEDYPNGETYVVMGGVPYALSTKDMRDSATRLGLYLDMSFYNMQKTFPVAIGSVDLTPNREGLRFTDRTTELVDSLLKSFHNGLWSTAQKEIDAIDDRHSVYGVVKKWDTILGTTLSTEFKWRDERIIRRIHLKKPVGKVTTSNYRKNSYGTQYSISLDQSDLHRSYVVTGRSVDTYRGAARNISDFIDGVRDTTNPDFYFVEEIKDELDTPWLTENSRFTVISVEEFLQTAKDYRKSQRPAKEPKEPKERVKITYPVLDIDEDRVDFLDASDVPSGAYVVSSQGVRENSSLGYILSQAPKSSRRSDIVNAVKSALPDVKHIVYVSATRKTEVLERKAKKSFTPLEGFVKVLAMEAEALMVDPRVAQYRHVTREASNNLYYAVAQREDVLDPMFTEFRADASVKADAERLMALCDTLDVLGISGASRPWERQEGIVRLYERQFDAKYKLFGHMWSNMVGASPELVDQAVAYVNAVYPSTLVNAD